jgi:predicted esterase
MVSTGRTSPLTLLLMLALPSIAAGGAACGHSSGSAAAGDAGADGAGAEGGTADGADEPLSCGSYSCNDTTGIAAPICACTAQAPCSCETIPFCNKFCPDGGTLSSSIDVPTCKTSTTCGGKHLVFDDGPAVAWTDGAQQRAYCLYSPPSASPTSQRPLVVFLHGSGGSADDLYDATSLRAKAPSYDLVGDGTRTGFFLAADQGRNLPNPNGNLGAAPRHDIYFRDLGTTSANPDVRAIDHLIDGIASGGAVDPARIYLVGWSNGAFFSALYAIARYATPTPGGFKVAGAAIFAGADPFDDPRATDDGGCSDRPYPEAPTAIYVIHRSCDSAVACDAAQSQQFSNPPGYDVSAWATTLSSTVGATVQEVILSAGGTLVAQCDDNFALCTGTVGLLNHVSWPDGLATEDAKTKNDWEGAIVGATPGILGFLGAHPHP